MANTRDMMGRLFELEQVLHDEIAAAGGDLRVGMYVRDTPVDDALGSVREVARKLREKPWLLDAYPMPPTALETLDALGDELEAEGYSPTFIAEKTRPGGPKMHRKTQFFATRRALRALADLPETHRVLPDVFRRHAAGTADPHALLEESNPLGPAGPIISRIRTDPPPGARDGLYYLTVGSKNQDFRSAFLDGETAYVVAGPWSLVYYPDFLYLMANTEWIETQEEFEDLITVDDTKSRKLGRWIRKVL
jgi:hypothetical protein